LQGEKKTLISYIPLLSYPQGKEKKRGKMGGFSLLLSKEKKALSSRTVGKRKKGRK